MRPVADSLVAALESICGIDTSDASSLAYASGLLAIEIAVPSVDPQEIGFEVSIGDNNMLTIDADELEIGADIRTAINVIATHYFQTVRFNLPAVVH
jgi:hypothetical protein